VHWSAATALSFGCSSSTAAAPVTNPLRGEQRRLLAMRAPRYSGTGERADTLRFVQSDLKAWIVERSRATDRLIEKYEAARAGAIAGTGKAVFFRDVAELQLEFSRELILAGTSAAPTDIRADPNAYRSYVGAIASVAEDRLERVVVEADTCADIAGSAQKDIASECARMKSDAGKLKAQASPVVRGLDGATRE